VFQKKNESHIVCFQRLRHSCAQVQPETRSPAAGRELVDVVGDEGEGGEILADYGEAWSFLLFLKDRYGAKLLESIHRDRQHRGWTAAGGVGLLAKHAKSADVPARFPVDDAADKLVSHGKVSGISRKLVTTPSLDSSITC